MEIKLSVDSHQLSNEVKTLVESLGVEQKQELAKQLLSQALMDVNGSLDKVYLEQKTLEASRILDRDPNMTLEHAKKQYGWSRRLEEQAGLKRELISSLLKGVVEEAKTQIVKQVKEDAAIQKVISETLDLVKSEFPTYVKNAMTMYLAQQMSQTMQGVASNMLSLGDTQNMINQLNNRLNQT